MDPQNARSRRTREALLRAAWELVESEGVGKLTGHYFKEAIRSDPFAMLGGALAWILLAALLLLVRAPEPGAKGAPRVFEGFDSLDDHEVLPERSAVGPHLDRV